MTRILDPVEKARNSHIRREAQRRRKAERARDRLREAAAESANMYGEDDDGALLDYIPEADQDFLGQTFYIDPDNEGSTTRVIQLQRNSNGGFSWKDMLNDEGEWNASFLMEFGEPGSGDGGFLDGIRGITVNPATGDVYVASGEGASSKIQKFSANGTFVANVATYGTGNGEVDTPWGMSEWVSGIGGFAVVDSGNHRIQIFQDTSYLSKSGSFGSGALNLDSPQDVAYWFQYSGGIWMFLVTDTGNNRIQLLIVSVLADVLEAFTYDGSVSPSGIVMDKNGRAFISDSSLNIVQTLDVELQSIMGFDIVAEPQFTIGEPGSGKNQFSSPTDIAIDSLGNLYIVDSANHRIQVFDSSGVFRGQWGKFGTGEGEFNNPTDIVITDDYIYVTDSGNHRVQIFRNPIPAPQNNLHAFTFRCAGGSNSSTVTPLLTVDEEIVLPRGVWEVSVLYAQTFTGTTTGNIQVEAKIYNPAASIGGVGNATSTGRTTVHEEVTTLYTSDGETAMDVEAGFVRSAAAAVTIAAQSGWVFVLCRRVD